MTDNVLKKIEAFRLAALVMTQSAMLQKGKKPHQQMKC